jgi:TRAP-type mannitol/chloroaromatic compound transport system substrate-binding protein
LDQFGRIYDKITGDLEKIIQSAADIGTSKMLSQDQQHQALQLKELCALKLVELTKINENLALQDKKPFLELAELVLTK